MAVSIAIDYFKGESLLSQVENVKRMLLWITGISSLMLAIAIGFLLVTQLYMISQNLTTLETFTEGIQNRVEIMLVRILGIGERW